MRRTSARTQSSQNTATSPVSHPPDAPGGPGSRRTRGVNLKFSHTKAPFVPPPAPPSERLPVPESIATRTRRAAKAKETAAETSAASQGPVDETGQQPDPEQTQNTQREPEQPNSDSRTNVESSAVHHSSPSSAALEAPVIRPGPPTQTTCPPGIIERTNVQTAASPEQGCEFAPLIPTLNNPPLSTPRRVTNRATFSFGTPTLLIPLETHPNGTDTQFPDFIPNHSTPFDPTFLRPSDLSPQHVSSMPSSSSNLGHRNTEFADPCSGLDTTEPVTAANSIQPNIAQDIFHSQPAPTPSSNYNMLYSAIMNSLPSFLPSAPIAPMPANFIPQHPAHTQHEVSNTWASRESSVLHDDLVPAQGTPALRVGSLPPDMTSRRQDSRQSSAAPQSSQSSSRAPTHLQPLPPASSRPRSSLRQADFTHDQVLAIRHMRRRYLWFLLTEDAFPVNVFTAREVCISYAEEVLGATRAEYGITNTTFDYVRLKESNLRNGFTVGLLKVVEIEYDVEPSSVAKLETLLKGSNYVYASFDLEQKKVAGRFLHPAISAVISLLLFTKQTRGQPLGIRFIRELMVGDGSPVPQSGSSESPPGAGAPVPLIAFACTLILHALQSIKMGDKSVRIKKTAPKPVKMSESKYYRSYRAILAEIKTYPRLDELRTTHMKLIMEKYLVAQSSSGNDSEEDVDFDKEMVSDGE
ncbi:hypothetical protein FRC12_007318 [Ceratobasidium sp. 428]|nr:hypothetical protein FRC12_007318 [Ceratobasidium sp. 428]